MKVFVDTSTLFKKYVNEPGSSDFDALLNEATEVVISVLTRVEIYTALTKTVRDKSLSFNHSEKLRSEIARDFSFYSCVLWNKNLEEKAVEIVSKFSLKSLDAIQLASGLLSKADIFVTSDKKLFEAANTIIRKARFI